MASNIETYISQGTIEKYFSKAMVQKVFTDDGRAVGPRLSQCCSAASRRIDGHLMTNFSQENIEEMLEHDAELERSACAMALSMGMIKPEWYRPGDTFRRDLMKDAEAYIKSVAKADIRTAAELEVQENPTYDPRIDEPEPTFLYAPKNGETPRGGF